MGSLPHVIPAPVPNLIVLSVKRHVVAKEFAKEIAELYQD